MKKKYLIVILFFSALIFTGCVKVNEEFSEIRDNVLSGIGNQYEAKAQFSVGTVGITISSWFVDFAQDEEYVDDMMREIDNVQVGIYKKLKDSEKHDHNTLLTINSEMESKGWKYILRSVDNGDFFAVYLRSNKIEDLNRIYIVTFDDEQLVLLDIEGDLKEVISTVIKEKGITLSSLND